MKSYLLLVFFILPLSSNSQQIVFESQLDSLNTFFLHADSSDNIHVCGVVSNGAQYYYCHGFSSFVDVLSVKYNGEFCSIITRGYLQYVYTLLKKSNIGWEFSSNIYLAASWSTIVPIEIRIEHSDVFNITVVRDFQTESTLPRYIDTVEKYVVNPDGTYTYTKL